jgi:hypothetical protein
MTCKREDRKSLTKRTEIIHTSKNIYVAHAATVPAQVVAPQHTQHTLPVVEDLEVGRGEGVCLGGITQSVFLLGVLRSTHICTEIERNGRGVGQRSKSF